MSDTETPEELSRQAKHEVAVVAGELSNPSSIVKWHAAHIFVRDRLALAKKEHDYCKLLKAALAQLTTNAREHLLALVKTAGQATPSGGFTLRSPLGSTYTRKALPTSYSIDDEAAAMAWMTSAGYQLDDKDWEPKLTQAGRDKVRLLAQQLHEQAGVEITGVSVVTNPETVITRPKGGNASVSMLAQRVLPRPSSDDT